MPLPSLLDAITVVVLIVPGFLSFIIFKKVFPSRKTKFSDFELIVYSLMYTLPILATFSLASGLNDIDNIRDNIFQCWNLFILIFISISWGFIPAFLGRLLLRNEYVTGECWDVFSERLDKCAYVIVYTQYSCEYKGWIHYMGVSESKCELILGDPVLILRKKNGSILTEIEMGNELLFTENDIRRIISFKPLK